LHAASSNDMTRTILTEDGLPWTIQAYHPSFQHWCFYLVPWYIFTNFTTHASRRLASIVILQALPMFTFLHLPLCHAEVPCRCKMHRSGLQGSLEPGMHRAAKVRHLWRGSQLPSEHAARARPVGPESADCLICCRTVQRGGDQQGRGSLQAAPRQVGSHSCQRQLLPCPQPSLPPVLLDHQAGSYMPQRYAQYPKPRLWHPAAPIILIAIHQHTPRQRLCTWQPALWTYGPQQDAARCSSRRGHVSMCDTCTPCRYRPSVDVLLELEAFCQRVYCSIAPTSAGEGGQAHRHTPAGVPPAAPAQIFFTLDDMQQKCAGVVATATVAAMYLLDTHTAVSRDLSTHTCGSTPNPSSPPLTKPCTCCPAASPCSPAQVPVLPQCHHQAGGRRRSGGSALLAHHSISRQQHGQQHRHQPAGQLHWLPRQQ
jgi:hypothetical protein